MDTTPSSTTKRVLLTGVAGFIGSHVLEHILVNTDWHVVGIASWKHKGLPERIEELVMTYPERVTVITHDLTAPLTEITKKRIGHIDYILNVASESHVDRSITDPVPFVMNNVSLMMTMLEYTREAKPEVFIQISTDEVYGAAELGNKFKEWSSIMPSNPYSASKAAQEDLAISYWRTFNVPIVITNTMNNFGERQDKEKYVSLVINKVIKGETVPVHGNKDYIGSRFYLHARNHADALLYILKNLPPKMFGEVKRPDRYNIVGERELNNLEMAELVAQMVGKPLKYELVDFHGTRPGHDPRYALDGSKLKGLGWKPPLTVEDSLRRTIDWTLKNPLWM